MLLATARLTVVAAGDLLDSVRKFAAKWKGIHEPSIRGRMFEPFFTTKPFGEGTGLGLDIAWRIVVNKHHGDLHLVSTPGDTRFQVRLPFLAPGPIGAASDPAARS